MLFPSLALALTLPLLSGEDLSTQSGYESAEFIYTEAPFPTCHAATLAETPTGLVVSFFGGTREWDPDVCIWVCRQEDGKWTAPQVAADGQQSDDERYPTWNPVLYQEPGGPLLLFYKVGPSPWGWWGMLRSSNDGGRTWGEVQKLPEGILGPVKNKPIRLPSGELLCPTSIEHDEKQMQTYFERTADLGKTWLRSPVINDRTKMAAIQGSILVHGDNKLQVVGRTQQGFIFSSESTDGGLSWSEVELLHLPNPHAGTDAVTLADGRHLLVYNHTEKGRSPLNVAISADGKKWQAALVLENEPGEYSYPAVIQTSDGKVHIIYTWKRQRIRHVVVDPQKLELRDIDGINWPTPAFAVPE